MRKPAVDLPTTVATGLGQWLEDIVRRVVREELAAAGYVFGDWRDQSQSPILGPRRHCRAVRRRLAANPQDPSAKRVGDRFLLTPDAIAEELDLIGHKSDKLSAGASKPSTPEEEAVGRVQRRLASIGPHQGRRQG